MDVLHSPDNPAFKALGKLLKDARARREAGRAVVEGPHLALEALKAGACRELWMTPEAAAHPDAAAILPLARRGGHRERLLAVGLLRRISDTDSPQGWLAVVDTAPRPAPGPLNLVLALDGLQDPGNLGTLLRTAWAAQASVLLGPGCADLWSPKVLRAGAGAQFHVACSASADLPAALRELAGAGLRVLGTGPRAQASYLAAPLADPVCLVLGAEGPGLSEAVAAACQELLRIPYPGPAESLNAAVAGALLLFEALRQRSKD